MKNWKMTTDGEANFYGIATIDKKNWLLRIQVNGELMPIKQLEIIKLIETAPEMLETLKSVNTYFVNIQNSVALTNPDEKAWKKVSKILNSFKEEESNPKYFLKENGIHIIGSYFVNLDDKLRYDELHEYYIIKREDFIDELINWISEATSDKQLMKDDLKMLMKLKDEYIFSSNSTNSYIHEFSENFNETCEELLELNKKLENEKS